VRSLVEEAKRCTPTTFDDAASGIGDILEKLPPAEQVRMGRRVRIVAHWRGRSAAGAGSAGRTDRSHKSGCGVESVRWVIMLALSLSGPEQKW
jgi:hypothetical protein